MREGKEGQEEGEELRTGRRDVGMVRKEGQNMIIFFGSGFVRPTYFEKDGGGA
jgi:hypothetical protein